MINYVSVNFGAGSTIKKAVETLQELKNKGIMAKGEFNGVTLYSNTVTLDGAYQSIIGKSYAQCLADEQAWIKDYDNRQEEYKNSLPERIKEWMIKGENVLDTEFVEEWNKIVPIRATDLYHGMELDASLEIIKVLNDGEPFEKAIEIIEGQGHSGMSYSLVCSIIQKFSKRGIAFVETLKIRDAISE